MGIYSIIAHESVILHEMSPFITFEPFEPHLSAGTSKGSPREHAREHSRENTRERNGTAKPPLSPSF